MQEYYFISANGEQVGPVKGEDLLSYNISPKTMVWGRDMSGWATADSVPELVTLLSSQQISPKPTVEEVELPQNNVEYVITPTDTNHSAGGNLEGKGSKKQLPVWLWFSMAILAIAVAAMSYLYIDANNKYTRMMSKTSSLRNEISEMEIERDNALTELSDFKSSVGSTFPIVITDIEIANVYNDGTIETDYGNSLYDYRTLYLKPRITYTGLMSGTKEFKIKWVMPSGSLRTGNSSPSGYSFSESAYVSEGTDNTLELMGWGNDNSGNWSSGRYRVEIWYENVCLKSKDVRIY